MRYLKTFNESLTSNVDPEIVMGHLFGTYRSQGIVPRSIWSDNNAIRDRIQIDPDGTVNVNGDITIQMSSHRLPVKFGRVTGTFKFYNCIYLGTLEGSPRECDSFDCKGTSIKNLIGAPIKVRNFEADASEITSLEGSPEEVSGNFSISKTYITSLVGGPKYVGGTFICNHAPLLTSLKGCPESASTLWCLGLRNIKSLDGLQGKSFERIHLSTDSKLGNIYDPRPLKECNFNGLFCEEPFMELVELFQDFGDQYRRHNTTQNEIMVKRFRESLDYNYIRDGSDGLHIDLFRLKEALAEFDIQPNIVSLKHYDLIDENGQVVNFRGEPI